MILILKKRIVPHLACKSVAEFSAITTQANRLLENGFSVTTYVYVEIAELLGIDAKTFTFSYASKDGYRRF